MGGWEWSHIVCLNFKISLVGKSLLEIEIKLSLLEFQFIRFCFSCCLNTFEAQRKLTKIISGIFSDVNLVSIMSNQESFVANCWP